LNTEREQEWSDSQPIYRQVRDMLAEMILEDTVKEGESMPVVRRVAAEFRLSPLTVLKGYRRLVDEGVVETRRGLGMFVREGGRKKLLTAEREKFLNEEWPRVYDTILRLGLNAEELVGRASNEEGK
jgi:GntR family transcriptional regulator